MDAVSWRTVSRVKSGDVEAHGSETKDFVTGGTASSPSITFELVLLGLRVPRGRPRGPGCQLCPHHLHFC